MLLVGSFEPFDEAEARRVGADDYLTKPFQSIRTLIGKVQHLLSGEKAGLDEATTRKLTPLAEAEQANRSDPEFLERSTADTAPLPEHMEASHVAEGARDSSFADLSMDDAMIESSPAGEYAGVAHSSQPRATAQYSAADLHDAGVAHVTESPMEFEETIDAYSPSREGALQPVGHYAPLPMATSEVALSDDALLDLGELGTSTSERESDDFFLDLFDESPAPAPSRSSSRVDVPAQSIVSDQFAATPAEAIEQSARPQFGEFAMASSDEAFEAQAAHQPLEASVATEELPSENEAGVATQLAPTERLPEGYRVEDAATAPEATQSDYTGLVDDPPKTRLITLDQISPEVIDAIARRAVEHLSAREVEQIAWEIVPDLAERLIKRRLEEGKL
jgi:CheY-like chemotaxis protein